MTVSVTDNAEFAFSRALEFAARGLLSQSLPAFEIACRLEPTCLLYRTEYALALSSCGRQQSALAEAAEALGILAQDGNSAFEDPYLLSRLGFLQSVVLGDEQQALDFFIRASELDPNDPDYLLASATSLCRLGMAAEAAEVATRCATLLEGTSPLGPRAACDRCRLARLLAPVDPAWACYLVDQGFAEAPDDSRVRHAAGSAALAVDDFESALTHFRRASELAPDWPDPQSGMQHAFLAMGLFEDAARLGSEVLDRWPDFADVRVNTGLALLDLGRHEDAGSLFDQLLSDGPDDPFAHICLGLCFAAQKRAAEARYHQARALELAPDDRDTQRISEEIDRLLEDDGGPTDNQKRLALVLLLIKAHRRRRMALNL